MNDGSIVRLWDEILSGRKTVEFRECNAYWWKRLFTFDFNSLWSKTVRTKAQRRKTDAYFTHASYPFIPMKAFFTIGYPKNNLPRIEAKVEFIVYYYLKNQLGTGIANPFEVTE